MSCKATSYVKMSIQTNFLSHILNLSTVRLHWGSSSQCLASQYYIHRSWGSSGKQSNTRSWCVICWCVIGGTACCSTSSRSKGFSPTCDEAFNWLSFLNPTAEITEEPIVMLSANNIQGRGEGKKKNILYGDLFVYSQDRVIGRVWKESLGNPI